jgi:Tfp pilus assembly protein PilV
MHRQAALRAVPRQRATTLRIGFTVVEVLVALVVITVGLLGVAGASTSALEGANAALRERTATTRARTRLALLAGGGCAAAADGEVRAGEAVVERWSVGSIVNGVRLVEARAQWDDIRRRRTVLLAGALLC